MFKIKEEAMVENNTYVIVGVYTCLHKFEFVISL